MGAIEQAIEKSDIGQLRNLRILITERILEKEAEAKKIIWVVQDRFMSLENFREDEYLLAIEYFVKEAKKLDESWRAQPGRMSPKEMNLEISHILVPESEYEGYFS